MIVTLLNGPQVLRQLVFNKIEIFDQPLPLRHHDKHIKMDAAGLGFRCSTSLKQVPQYVCPL